MGCGGRWRYVARLCATGPECGPHVRIQASVDGGTGGTRSTVRDPAGWCSSGSLQQLDHRVWQSPGTLRLALQLVGHTAESLPAAAFAISWPSLLQSSPSSEGETQTCPSRDPVVLQGRLLGLGSSPRGLSNPPTPSQYMHCPFSDTQLCYSS